MVKNRDLPESAAHPQSGLSLSPSPFTLRVPLDPAEAGPRQKKALLEIIWNHKNKGWPKKSPEKKQQGITI